MEGLDSFNYHYRNTDPFPQGQITDNIMKDSAEVLARQRLQTEKTENTILFYENSIVDDETTAILPHELLCTRKRLTAADVGIPVRQSLLTSTLIDSGYPLVFSSTNGTGVVGPITYYGKVLKQNDFNNLPERVQCAMIRQYFAYAGFAKADVDLSKGGKQEGNKIMVSAAFTGGKTKTVHTGRNPIHAGDIVIWDVRPPKLAHSGLYPPSKTDLFEPTGTPKNKLLFCTEPLDYKDLVSYDSVYDIINSGHFKLTTTKSESQINNANKNYHYREEINPLEFIDFSSYEEMKGYYILESFINDKVKFTVHTIAVGKAMRSDGTLDPVTYVNEIENLTKSDNMDNLVKTMKYVMGEKNATKVPAEIKKNHKALFLYTAATSGLYGGIGKASGEVLSRQVAKSCSTVRSKQNMDIVIGPGYAI